MKTQEQKDAYCGLDCGLLLDQLDKILEQCRIHSDYDPIFAPKMVQKLIDKCNETKTELMTKQIEWQHSLFASP